MLTTVLFTTSAFAADSDPLTIVNNLSDFIFSCIKAIGIIILGWGVVQLGMSVQSHDATQRTQGVLLPVRWLTDRLCKGNFDSHRCGVSDEAGEKRSRAPCDLERHSS